MRALTPEGHRGYQKWHRELDANLVDAVDNAKSLRDFQRRINELYRNPEIVKIFGKIKIVL